MNKLAAPVPAQYFEDLPEEGKAPAGSFTYYTHDGQIAGMIYTCPCGCGRQGTLAISPNGQHPRIWKWDGNRTKPTLEPSINDVNHWHGYLKAGIFSDA